MITSLVSHRSFTANEAAKYGTIYRLDYIQATDRHAAWRSSVCGPTASLPWETLDRTAIETAWTGKSANGWFPCRSPRCRWFDANRWRCMGPRLAHRMSAHGNLCGFTCKMAKHQPVRLCILVRIWRAIFAEIYMLVYQVKLQHDDT